MFVIPAPPEITVERPWVHAGEGHEAQLVCIVHGEAHPEVKFSFSFQFPTLNTNFPVLNAEKVIYKYEKTEIFPLFYLNTLFNEKKRGKFKI